MKEKKKYAKAYKNLVKSYFVIFLFSFVLFFILLKVFNQIFSAKTDALIMDVIAIILGIIFSILYQVIDHVIKDRKAHISDIENDNKILKNSLNDLKLIANMIEFNVNSKKSELELLVIYREIELCKKTLMNHKLFDSISQIGINSLFKDLSATLLKISNKKEFVEESSNLLSDIEHIIKMVEELILSNNNEKDAFLKEEEYLNHLFEESKKS